MSRAHHPARELALLAAAQVGALTLWFSATAALPSLILAWDLSQTAAAWMTASVQLGFVVGAVVSAVFNLPDVIPPRRMFALCAFGGAVTTVLLATVVSGAGAGIALRGITGLFLAGVYPPGMKIAAGHVSGSARGLAIGVLVGALTAGSGTPHLIAALLGDTVLDYRVVLLSASGLAVIGAVIVQFAVHDGPKAPAPVPFDPSQIGRVFKHRPIVLTNLGYSGHMWELYGMWAWLAAYLGAALDSAVHARLLSFITIAIAGSIACVAAGVVADRVGRTRVTSIAMAISCACCIASPWAFEASLAVLAIFGVIWGASIIADSAQFSAAVTELAEPSYMGTALTLQTSIGFTITLIPIWVLPYLAEGIGWRWAFLFLAPGPALGIVAMQMLRRDPASLRMASGNR